MSDPVVSAKVQLLFAEQSEAVLVLDLVALEGLTWSTGQLTAGSPFTMAVVVPGDAGLDEITLSWADDCAVLFMTLIDAPNSEMVFLEGDDEQVLMELPKGRLAAGDS
jgi:hypothetical protein